MSAASADDPGADRPVQLADHECAPVAAQDDAGLEHVRAEVDYGLDDPLRAERGGEYLRGQPVLQRDRERRPRSACPPASAAAARV